ncbi:hypothetical protein [Compostimonas suwonensis]|uniref:Uncharacterized protein n=1 Tax=Compostimonas suwonensis TaxID=1048394 RepID=A0A2M9C3N2_9MICO|nr:hypothetical protein [Compostimonas suwonensis]PJJ65128.1 hypothetical protein CLV54_0157 [Compostimonas suwonensis]
MNWWVLGSILLVIVAGYLAHRLGWIDLSDKHRRRGGSTGSGVLHIGDEVFAPTRHEAAVELDRQTVLPAPAPVAGEDDKGVYEGRIRIRVDGRG